MGLPRAVTIPQRPAQALGKDRHGGVGRGTKQGREERKDPTGGERTLGYKRKTEGLAPSRDGR